MTQQAIEVVDSRPKALARVTDDQGVSVAEHFGVEHATFQDTLLALGDPLAYARLEDTSVRDEVLGAIADWLARRLRARP